MKETIRRILLIFFFVLLCFSGWKVFGILEDYRESGERYENLEQYVSFVPEPSHPAETGTPTADPTESMNTESTTPTQMPDVSSWPQVDFEQLAAINPDIVGWIYIDGTNIHYPIVQGSDNDYYLTRMFDGHYNPSGSIFLDYRCAADFSQRHSIIYGHYIRNSTMFGGLMKYKKQAFYEEHHTALLVTPDAYFEIQFFSGYVTDNWDNAWDLDLDDPDHEIWLQEVQEKSCFKPVCIPSAENRIITLSTCTYEFDDAKFVLHGYVSREIRNSTVHE